MIKSLEKRCLATTIRSNQNNEFGGLRQSRYYQVCKSLKVLNLNIFYLHLLSSNLKNRLYILYYQRIPFIKESMLVGNN